MLDLLIRGGEVVDGSGGRRFTADVAVRDGRIVGLGPNLPLPAQRVIDAAGRIVAPGFIDCHTHDDTAVNSLTHMVPKLLQGVTTVVAGNCGIGAAPATRSAVPPPLDLLDRRGFDTRSFATFIGQVEARRPQVNVAFFVGLTAVRVEVMDDTTRAATPAEIARMRDLVAGALEAGAIGASVGAYYPPAEACTLDEVLAVCAPLDPARHLMSVHLRDEGDEVLAAMEEAATAAARLKVPLVISHHKLIGRRNHGRSAETLRRIESYARAQAICMDCYPYAASSTMLDPERVDEARQVLVAWSTPHPEHAGRDLDELAAGMGCSRREAARRLLPGGGVYFSMDMADVKAILSHPLAMVASDGLPHDAQPHPRLWGSFPRVLGRLVREERWFPLETAVHKMTGLPAERFGLAGRGRVAEGAWADLVVLDEHRVMDIASYASPRQAPSGIESVIVNGRVKVDGAQVALPAHGRVLRR
jgi:N-acyl-D-amino-acid deacylase